LSSELRIRDFKTIPILQNSNSSSALAVSASEFGIHSLSTFIPGTQNPGIAALACVACVRTFVQQRCYVFSFPHYQTNYYISTCTKTWPMHSYSLFFTFLYRINIRTAKSIIMYVSYQKYVFNCRNLHGKREKSGDKGNIC